MPPFDVSVGMRAKVWYRQNEGVHCEVHKIVLCACVRVRGGKKRLILGFCFSYPVDQHELGAGTLIQWTKEFNVQDAVGKDVVQLLQDAFHRQVCCFSFGDLWMAAQQSSQGVTE